MPEPRIPATVAGLTADWLTDALRETGTIKYSRVTDVEHTVDIGAGFGFMCQLTKLGMTYDRPEQGAPSSIIAKLPTPVESNRNIADVFRFYELESRFYEDVAGSVELRTPHCFYNARATDSSDFVLLLEDLAPARVADQVAGCTLEQAELALRELAKFHATWWENPRLDEFDWLWSFDNPVRSGASQQSYKMAWGPFAESFGKLVTPEVFELGKRFGDQVVALTNQLARRPVTISHGDYRLDNLFFSTAEGGEPLAVIDWQIMSKGRGLFDVALFMTGTLDPDVRREKDEPFLRMYHDILVENGVNGYDFDECWHDYRVSTLFCWLYAVIALGTMDIGNERGLQLFTRNVQRSAAAVTDLNAGELLPA